MVGVKGFEQNNSIQKNLVYQGVHGFIGLPLDCLTSK
jgi:hypothetical protein